MNPTELTLEERKKMDSSLYHKDTGIALSGKEKRRLRRKKK